MQPAEPQLALYECPGSCHCGQVTFRVRVPEKIKVQSCNCSICRKTGFVHLIVRGEDFEITLGAGILQEYRFNTQTARHWFCKNCGVKAFYIPRSHPGGYSVNLNCVRLNPAIQITKQAFDGQNWENNVSLIKDLA